MNLQARIFREILGWYVLGGLLLDLVAVSSSFASALPLISPCERFIIQVCVTDKPHGSASVGSSTFNHQPEAKTRHAWSASQVPLLGGVRRLHVSGAGIRPDGQSGFRCDVAVEELSRFPLLEISCQWPIVALSFPYPCISVLDLHFPV
jgi:hypothetical protein